MRNEHAPEWQATCSASCGEPLRVYFWPCHDGVARSGAGQSPRPDDDDARHRVYGPRAHRERKTSAPRHGCGGLARAAARHQGSAEGRGAILRRLSRGGYGRQDPRAQDRYLHALARRGEAVRETDGKGRGLETPEEAPPRAICLAAVLAAIVTRVSARRRSRRK